MENQLNPSKPIEPIGHVESCYPGKFGTPRQSGLVPEARGFLRISKTWQPEIALEGLAEFSHLWVIFLFHQLKDYRYHAKVHPPRLMGESRGVFATRSPHRPNPIGLSLVEILSVDAEGVWVKGLDLVDGTPILDIKPYLVERESLPQARSGWTESSSGTDIEVVWSEEIQSALEAWSRRLHRPELRNLIENTLKLDPRPVVYRGREGQVDAPYRDHHAVRFYDGDVHFRFSGPQTIEIISIHF